MQYREGVYNGDTGELTRTRVWDTDAATYSEVTAAGTPLMSRPFGDVDRGLMAPYMRGVNADTMRGSLRSMLPQLIANQASAAPVLLNLGWAQTTDQRCDLLERAVVALLRIATDADDTTAGTT